MKSYDDVGLVYDGFWQVEFTTTIARCQEFRMKKIVGYIEDTQDLGQLSEHLKDIVKEPKQGILVCKCNMICFVNDGISKHDK